MSSTSRSNSACSILVFFKPLGVVYCPRIDYVDPDEPTLSDQDFIDDAPIDEEFDVQDGFVDSEADMAVERRSDYDVEYGSEDNGEEPGGVDQGDVGDDQVNCHITSTALYPLDYSLT